MADGSKVGGVYGDRVVARNRRASFDYELGRRFEAGLVLAGSEVKMLRMGAADLTDAWCAVANGEALLHGLHIPELPGAAFGHDPKRARKLLLHAREIAELGRAVERQGMTAVVTALYFKNGRAKVEVALARGKRKLDKRQSLREREDEREAEAALARARRR